jgi:hypothetical protein
VRTKNQNKRGGRTKTEKKKPSRKDVEILEIHSSPSPIKTTKIK